MTNYTEQTSLDQSSQKHDISHNPDFHSQGPDSSTLGIQSLAETRKNEAIENGLFVLDPTTGQKIVGAQRNQTKYKDLPELLSIAHKNGLKDLCKNGLEQLLEELVRYKPENYVYDPYPTKVADFRNIFNTLIGRGWAKNSGFMYKESKFVENPGLLLQDSKAEDDKYIKFEHVCFPENGKVAKEKANITGYGGQDVRKDVTGYVTGSSNASSIITKQNARLKQALTKGKTKLDTLPENSGSGTSSEEFEDAEEDSIGDEDGEKTFNNFCNSFEKFKRVMSKKISKMNKLGKQCRDLALEAKDTAEEAKDDVNKAFQEINKVQETLKAVVPVDPATEEDRQFILQQNFEFMIKAQQKYRKAVHDEKRKGALDIHIVDNDKFTVVTNDVRIARTTEIEDKLERVRLENVTLHVKKNGKCLVTANVSSKSTLRSEITHRIANETTGKYRSCFGVNVRQPKEYDITRYLGFLRKECVDPITGFDVILKFDISKLGFLVIYLNDKDETKRAELQRARGREAAIKDEQCCTRWHPTCPLQILKLRKSQITIDNLRKLADWRNYFLWEGKIYETPETVRAMQKEADRKKEEEKAIAGRPIGVGVINEGQSLDNDGW